MNGVDQSAETKPIEPDSDSISDQKAFIGSIDKVAPDTYEDLDSLELMSVIPEPDKESRLVEGIFNFNGSCVPVFVPLQYAEQQKHCTSLHSQARWVETQIRKTTTDHGPGSELPLSSGTGFIPLPPTPPTPTEATNPAHPSNLINCENLEAFAAWAQVRS